MKRIFFFILFLCLLCSCGSRYSRRQADRILFEADSLYAINELYENDSLLMSAMSYYTSHLRPYKAEKTKIDYYRGLHYSKNKCYADAMECFLQADAYNAKSSIQGHVKSEIAWLYGADNQYDKALEYYSQAANLFSQLKDSMGYSYALINMGMAYNHQKDYANALTYYKKAFESSNDSAIIGWAHNRTSMTYYYTDQLDSATLHINHSFKYARNLQDSMLYHNRMASIYKKRGQLDTASYYALQAINMTDNPYIINQMNKIISANAIQNNDIKQLAKSTILEDSIAHKIIAIEQQSDIVRVVDSYIHQTEICRLSKLLRLIILIMGIIFLTAIVLAIVYGRVFQQQKNHIEKLKLADLHELRTKIREIEAKANERIGKPQYNIELLWRFKEQIRFDKTKPEIFLKWAENRLENLPIQLKKLYPGITEKEIIHCCFLLLDVSIDNIAILMKIKPSSVSDLRAKQLIPRMHLNKVKQIKPILEQIYINNSILIPKWWQKTCVALWCFTSKIVLKRNP